MKLTLMQQYEECQYLISERLCILCEDREPTPEQRQIAEREAAEWQKRYLAKDEPQRQLKMFL